MSARFVLVIVPVLLVSSAACGPDERRENGRDVGPDVGADLGGETELDRIENSFCRPVAEHLCTTRQACGCGAESCFDEQVAACLEQMDEIAEDVAAGLITFNTELTMACVDEAIARHEGCEILSPRVLDSMCAPVVAEAAALGESCSELFCANGEGECVGGVCEPIPALGDFCRGTCAGTAICIDGLCVSPVEQGGACDNDGSCVAPLRCTDGVCVPAIPVGTSCEQTADCQVGAACVDGACMSMAGLDCDGSTDCGPQARCDGTANRVCRPTVPEGTPCTQTSQCGEGAFCSSASETCTSRPGEGESCGEGTYCAPGFACGFGSGVCEPTPGDGEPCALDFLGPRVCGDGLGCRQGVCGPMPELDEECTIDNRCAGDLGCDFTAEGSFCRPRRGESQECQADHICVAGMFCDFGRGLCTPYLEPGGECSDGNECGPSGSCVPDDAGEFRCVTLPVEGEDCLFDCADGLACVLEDLEATCVLEICLDG